MTSAHRGLVRRGLRLVAEAVRFTGARVRNRVLLTLGLVGGISAGVAGFVSYAPNRLVSGRPIALWIAASDASTAAIAAIGAVMILASWLPPTRVLNRIVAALGTALLLVVLLAAGDAAMLLTTGAPAAVRVSLGTAFWIVLFCTALTIVDAFQRLRSGPIPRLAVATVIFAAVAAMAGAGQFDALSIVREYENRRDVFTGEIERHCALVLGALLPALALGVPLGLAVVRRPKLRGPLFATLNLLQTIPSVALFGLLIVPLSALAEAVPAVAAIGIRGIGFAPAIIALVLYSLLPVVRNTHAGFAGVDRAVIETAQGMGLTRRQIFRRVELPLAMPVLLAGLRIVTVQAIGLAVVAALIGAGGLGTFVFQGLGQDAVDLVLLGAVPAILLALAADFILQILTAFARQRVAP